MGNHVLIDDSKLSPSWISYFLCYLGLGWFTTIPLLIFIAPPIWQYFQSSSLRFLTSPLIALVVGTIILSAIYPVDRDMQPLMGFNLGRFIIKNCRSYFSFKIEFENLEEVESLGPSIFVIEPHGVLPIQLFWGTLDIMRNHKILCCVSDSVFLLPMMKHVLTWCGGTSASRDSIISYLKKGYSLNICPGGVQEVQYLGNPKECVIFMKSRVGLTKLALTQGVAIVPSMTFGSHKLYDYWVPTQDWVIKLGRRIGFLPMLFFGLGNIPFAQAKPCPLTVVVGKPIQIPHIPNPTSEDIDKYHQILLHTMEKLYNDNNEANNMSDVKLVIV